MLISWSNDAGLVPDEGPLGGSRHDMQLLFGSFCKKLECQIEAKRGSYTSQQEPVKGTSCSKSALMAQKAPKNVRLIAKGPSLPRRHRRQHCLQIAS